MDLRLGPLLALSNVAVRSSLGVLFDAKASNAQYLIMKVLLSQPVENNMGGNFHNAQIVWSRYEARNLIAILSRAS